jgi:hypothetical protein
LLMVSDFTIVNLGIDPKQSPIPSSKVRQSKFIPLTDI